MYATMIVVCNKRPIEAPVRPSLSLEAVMCFYFYSSSVFTSPNLSPSARLTAQAEAR